MDNRLPNGAMSNCQSGGSVCPPSQQRPKMSIGIMVGKALVMSSATRNDDETRHPVKNVSSSSQEKTAKENIVLGRTSTSLEKGASPWVSTRSVHSERPYTKANCSHAKALVFQSDDGLHEELKCAPCEMRKQKSGDVEEIAFAAMQGAHSMHQENEEEPAKFTEGRSETLRMKLWEALGAASSQYKRIPSLPLANENIKVSKPEICVDNHVNEIPKSRQETDTIETDSENPEMTLKKSAPHQSMRRPFTRSLARKEDPENAPTKLQRQKNAAKNLSTSGAEKYKTGEMNNFSFDGGEKRKKSSLFLANGPPTVTALRKRSARVEPRKISFPSSSTSIKSLRSDESLPSDAKGQTLLPPQNEAGETHAMQGSRTSHSEMKEKGHLTSFSESGKTAHLKGNQLEDLSNTLFPNRTATGELDVPPLNQEFQSSQYRSSSRHGLQHVEVHHQTLPNGLGPLDHSPTLVANITPSLEKGSIGNSCRSSFLSEDKLRFRNTRFPLKQTRFSESDAYPETSDGARDSQTSPTGESSPIVMRPIEGRCSSQSQVQSLSSARLADEITGKDLRKKGTLYSEGSDHRKSPATLHPSKRARNLENIEVRKLDPSPSFPFHSETEEAACWSQELDSHCFTDQCPQDSLARAITQLAVVLERFKAKIKSHTYKKSSEILSSAGEGIHLHIQDVESLIQADIEKFTVIGKSKRKQLESNFLEQQEKLKAIHDKFKEEINLHLMDCRSTLEDLEIYQEELKGNVERQKAAHRKLILKAEEAMKAELEDAETNIAAVHKAARKKMEDMRYALREWLSDDGMLN